MLENMAFLYIEDDPSNCKLMQLMMTRLVKVGHLFIFDDSTDFIDRLTDLDPKPDVILMDIHVKPLNGFDMLPLIRQLPHYQATPVIALTAVINDRELAQIKTAGFDGMISKPLSMSVFPMLLQEIANGDSVWYIV